MTDNCQYAALEWVFDEIKTTLTQAGQALENYYQDDNDVSQLHFCLTYIHQVCGALHMLEFHSAAMLAEEMEALVQAVVEQRVVDRRETQELLMYAILQLPNYLAQAQQTRRDHPSAILPLINDLRRFRDASALPQSRFFAPDLSRAYHIGGDRLSITQNDQQFKSLMGKLRQMYRRATASLFRELSVDVNIEYFVKVCEYLKTITRNTYQFAMWEITAALAEGLRQHIIAPTSAIKELIHQLDRQLERLEQHGAAVLDERVEEKILERLLHCVVNAHSDASFIDRIKENYGLDGGDQASLKLTDNTALRAVGEAIKLEINDIKQTLDHCLNDENPTLHLDNIGRILVRINDTLVVLGIGGLRQKIQSEISLLQRLRQQPDLITQPQLLAVAQKIAEIEDCLDHALHTYQNQAAAAQSSSYHFDKAQIAVLRESRNGLEKVKDAITEYIAGQWRLENIRPVPALLHETCGGLSMLLLERPSRILKACADYIQQQWIVTGTVPEWRHIDSLADVIAGVDYYLERMLCSFSDDNEFLLAVAEQSMTALGYGVAPLQSEQQRQPAAKLSAGADTTIAAATPAATNTTDGATEDAADSTPPLPPLDASTPVAGNVDSDKASAAAIESQAIEPQNNGDADGDMLDDEIIEIFIEEAEEIHDNMAVFLPQWAADFNDIGALTEVRRAFHTLKGSGRMVHANEIGELAWSIENMLNRIIDHTIVTTETIICLTKKVAAILADMIEAFANHRPPSQPQHIEQYMAWAHQLANGDAVDIPDQVEVVETAAASSAADRPPVAEKVANDAVAVTGATVNVDPQLLEIFLAESTGHLNTVKSYIAEVEASMPIFHPPSDLMQRALHTLKGSAFITDILSIANLVTPIESLVKELRNYQVDINADILQLIKECVSHTEMALAQLADNVMPEIPASKAFIARTAQLRESTVGALIHQQKQYRQLNKVDPKQLEHFMIAEMDRLLCIDSLVDSWRSEGGQIGDWQAIINELDTLSLGAKQANLPSMVDLSDSLRRCYRALIARDIDGRHYGYDLLQEGHNVLLNMLDAVAIGHSLPALDEHLLDRLQSLYNGALIGPPVAATEVKSKTEGTAELPVDAQGSPQTDDSEAKTSPAEQAIDEEIVDIFLDEANELLENIDETIHRWQADRSDDNCNRALQRSLHTFKGGARSVGLHALGDLAHRFEALLTDTAANGALTDDLFVRIQDFQDKLHHGVAAVTSGAAAVDEMPPPADAVIDKKDDGEDNKKDKDEKIPATRPIATESTVDTDPAQLADTNVLAFAPKDTSPKSIASKSKATSTVTDTAKEKRSNAPQEFIRVPAALIEELVNLAGETSISRGRMEEQVNDMGSSLDDMDETVQRLQGQIRRLDIETEAQVLFRQEQMAAELSEFDPLEMDRYTQLQQLTRSLIESASDLMDLKSTLLNKIRDTETILLQQSRINTDLQEGLMRSRMVPFSRMVPRLGRIVRQISSELNKSVNFHCDNVEGELDRSILERMVPPLEHMLRNAVDHGIEDPQTRTDQGKPDAGRIVLSLSREGGDILLRLSDDGCGISLAKVRQKAIEHHLMDADTQLDDQDILQFIFHSGFSTADKVTQISGRGVGMDVVKNDIKQVGGGIYVESTLGRGTTFTIRLPFTVSVNRALMVVIGEHRYAIPLNTIEGVVRLKPKQLKRYYADPDSHFDYAGKHYQVRYLASIINIRAKPKLAEENLSVPMLLVHSGDRSIALQVDQLQGSSEIVVKSLGAQFNAVQGLSGATIMGDGNVVIILNLHALLHRHAMPDRHSFAPSDKKPDKALTNKRLRVMVVDDSVTVRKVTTRLLEREGFDVVTAKDGVEAMNMLQDYYPDVMLLDIEMPRMDGFEVAKNVRSNAALKKLPIIMITSRTGEKHRRRGLDLGVNIYMGKPYQEEKLLSNIAKVIGAANSV